MMQLGGNNRGTQRQRSPTSTRPLMDLSCHFLRLANNLFGILIVSQADELGMSKMVRACPFKKFDLGHCLGFQPDALQHLFRS